MKLTIKTLRGSRCTPRRTRILPKSVRRATLWLRARTYSHGSYVLALTDA